MEESNLRKKGNLSVFFLVLALIIIIVMGFYIYKLYTEKTKETEKSAELQTQVNSLNENVNDLQEKINKVSEITKSNNSNETNTSTKENDNSDIQLDGYYVIPDSDVGWDFSKDGKVAYSGNVSVTQGTYKTTGKNTIEIHYTKNKVWDDETGEEKSSNIDSYEHITIDDSNNIYWTSPDGEKVKLERDGDARIESFE